MADERNNSWLDRHVMWFSVGTAICAALYLALQGFVMVAEGPSRLRTANLVIGIIWTLLATTAAVVAAREKKNRARRDE